MMSPNLPVWPRIRCLHWRVFNRTVSWLNPLYASLRPVFSQTNFLFRNRLLTGEQFDGSRTRVPLASEHGDKPADVTTTTTTVLQTAECRRLVAESGGCGKWWRGQRLAGYVLLYSQLNQLPFPFFLCYTSSSLRHLTVLVEALYDSHEFLRLCPWWFYFVSLGVFVTAGHWRMWATVWMASVQQKLHACYNFGLSRDL